MIVLLAAVSAFGLACLARYHVRLYRALKQLRLETEELFRRIRAKESNVWQSEESKTWVEDKCDFEALEKEVLANDVARTAFIENGAQRAQESDAEMVALENATDDMMRSAGCELRKR